MSRPLYSIAVAVCIVFVVMSTIPSCYGDEETFTDEVPHCKIVACTNKCRTHHHPKYTARCIHNTNPEQCCCKKDDAGVTK
ncbi:hypothetical protein OsJ_28708 [Oryza sativa Japonica Group]|uniref:Uncharacterized protein n=3 Tax=Oryza TaxID=4527 RepID=A3BWZ9_ORYSJ|nr:hypothetical protein OsJ_28708 [Oryza sativa Japonica Group]KAF2915481.1 hypothetical protein DAI22_09g037300 [Oryza sativa Japonica Group]